MSKDHNSLSIIGRVTANAELNYTAAGMAIGSFSIAVNRRKKSGDQHVDEVNFFRITSFAKTAENTTQYLTKGKQVAIDGELKQDRWTDQNSGQARSSVSIIANNIQFLRNPGDNDGSQAAPQGGQLQPAGQPPAGNYNQQPAANTGQRQAPPPRGYQQPAGQQRQPAPAQGYQQPPPTGQRQPAQGQGYQQPPAQNYTDFEDDIPF